LLTPELLAQSAEAVELTPAALKVVRPLLARSACTGADMLIAILRRQRCRCNECLERLRNATLLRVTPQHRKQRVVSFRVADGFVSLQMRDRLHCAFVKGDCALDMFELKRTVTDTSFDVPLQKALLRGVFTKKNSTWHAVGSPDAGLGEAYVCRKFSENISDLVFGAPGRVSVYQIFGAGAFGFTFGVVSDGERVAMKLVQSGKDDSALFHAEVETQTAMARLEVGPAVLSEVIDAPAHKGMAAVHAYTMERIDRTLGSVLFRNLSAEAVKSLTRQLVALVQTLYDHGYAHGDMHMDNIALSQGKVQLIDFGKTVHSPWPAIDIFQLIRGGFLQLEEMLQRCVANTPAWVCEHPLRAVKRLRYIFRAFEHNGFETKLGWWENDSALRRVINAEDCGQGTRDDPPPCEFLSAAHITTHALFATLREQLDAAVQQLQPLTAAPTAKKEPYGKWGSHPGWTLVQGTGLVDWEYHAPDGTVFTDEMQAQQYADTFKPPRPKGRLAWKGHDGWYLVKGKGLVSWEYHAPDGAVFVDEAQALAYAKGDAQPKKASPPRTKKVYAPVSTSAGVIAQRREQLTDALNVIRAVSKRLNAVYFEADEVIWMHIHNGPGLQAQKQKRGPRGPRLPSQKSCLKAQRQYEKCVATGVLATRVG
jgi:hypothetical protein